MKLFAFVKYSRGENPLELDGIKLFHTREEAIAALNKEYEEELKWCKLCGDYEDTTFSPEYYEIYFYDEYQSRYVGEIRSVEL